ncbi:MAG: hypothetical protein ACYTDX_04950, partial [Planctomycetota bacterium]
MSVAARVAELRLGCLCCGKPLTVPERARSRSDLPCSSCGAVRIVTGLLDRKDVVPVSSKERKARANASFVRDGGAMVLRANGPTLSRVGWSLFSSAFMAAIAGVGLVLFAVAKVMLAEKDSGAEFAWPG